MDLGLTDRVAVVLASTSGLGLAVARALAGEGARVALSGRDPARLEGALEELRAAHGARVHGEPLDVTDAEALARHVDGVRERWGPVEVLVTNAGGPPPATALEVDDPGLDAAFELTFRSALHAVRACLPDMRARGWGRIVGLTSLSVRQPIPSLAYSNVMRTALTSWFKSLAGEVARDGVLVNTICTGLFATERLEELFASRARASGRSVDEERKAALATVPRARFGDPDELGTLVTFLCSERCSYLTGVALPVDGGALGALL